MIFNVAKKGILEGSIDLDADDIRAALLMSGTGAATADDVATVSAISPLSECDDSGAYARQTLDNPAISQNNTSDRAELDGDDLSFAGLAGDGSQDYVGVLLYKHVTNDADSIPIAYVPFMTPVTAAATTQVDVPWDATGIIHLRNPTM